MATTKQKKVARLLVDNLQSDSPLTAGEMLEKVGYATSVAEHKPKEILESQGVKEELTILGFSIEEADKTIATLLKSAEREETKIKAAQEIYKRLSAYAPEKSVNVNYNRTENSKLDELVARIEAELDEPEGTA